MYYLALVHRDPDAGGYGFTIPDITGFTAHADTDSLDEAVAVARRILADHIAALVDAKLPVPEARAAEEVLLDPDVTEELEEAMATILLPAIQPAGRTVRINISIDENTLALTDSAAHDRSLTRSAFIAEACRRFAGEGEVEAKDLIFRIPARAFRDAGFQDAFSNVCRNLSDEERAHG